MQQHLSSLTISTHNRSKPPNSNQRPQQALQQRWLPFSSMSAAAGMLQRQY
jgi:hypothetical protein